MRVFVTYGADLRKNKCMYFIYVSCVCSVCCMYVLYVYVVYACVVCKYHFGLHELGWCTWLNGTYAKKGVLEAA